MYVDPDPECHEDGWGTARSIAVSAVAVAAFLGAYVSAYGADRYLAYADSLGRHGVVLQFSLIAGVLVVHEAIHALAYVLLGGVSWDDVAVQVEFEPGNPLEPVQHSVHPTGPIRRWAYFAGVAAPTVLLGVVPATLALLTGSALAMFVGVVGLLLVATDVGTLVRVWRRPETAVASEPAN